MGIEKTQDYTIRMRALFNKRALYSDETEMYQSPNEPDPGDTVRVRFRTLRNNVDGVFFISGSRREEMQLQGSENGFDYYYLDVPVGTEPIRYYFEIQYGRMTCYFNKLGVSKDLHDAYAFGIIPGFRTPDWAKGAVMYQIFVDRFCNGDASNDVETGEYSYIHEQVNRVEDWNRPVQNMDVRNFYGGDLQGVLDKLDYLKSLGVEVIYLNPIFVSPSNHKYDCQDYDYVDPHIGKITEEEEGLLPPGVQDNTRARRYISRVTDKRNLEASNQLLIRLIEEVHRRGMKIILDGVFNHCGSFNKWMDRERIYECQPGYEKGAYITKESPYHSYFKFLNEHSWPYNEFYDGWWGHNTLPKLNYEESPGLVDEIMRVARKWVSPPFCADGWRLDVAADLGHSPEFNHHFWKEFRRNVKEANPDALILAEHYGDASSWLQGDEWDSVMNYDAFMEPVSWFLTGMEKHSDSFRQDLLGNSDSFCNAMRYHMAAFFMPSLLTAMNELDNHDHSRFLTRTNHRVGRVENSGARAAEEGVCPAVMREAVVIQMTWPGAPTIYYGDEAGLCGFTDPDNRRTYPWGHEDQEMIRFYREIIRLRKRHPALRTGSLKMLHHDHNLLVYGRFNEEEEIIVAVNNRGEKAGVEIPAWETGMARISRSETVVEEFRTDAAGFSSETRHFPVHAGLMNVVLEPQSAVIFCHRETRQDPGAGR
jgi:alpha-glucosidase